MTVLGWLRSRDNNLSALRRTGRAAIVLPSLFAVGNLLLGDAVTGLFASVGSVALLLFVDFGGPIRDRVFAQGALVVAGAALVSLGTLVSRTVWLAAVTTVVVAFVVLFAAVVSSVLASATTSLLVSFILPASLPGSLATLPDRLLGWAMAGVVSMVAIAVLWPSPVRNPLRIATARACALLAQRLRTEVECVRCGFLPNLVAEVDDVVAESHAAVTALRDSFFGTPYRPTGLTTSTRTLVRLIDEVVWLEEILARMPVAEGHGATTAAVSEVKLAAALLLDHGAGLLKAVASAPDDLIAEVARLHTARHAMELAVTSALPAPDTAEFVTSLEPSFRAQEMTFAISAIAQNIELTVAARRRTWWEHLIGRRPDGAGSALSSVQERTGAHVAWNSVTMHNSLRGGIALGAAVLIAGLTGVEHSFWVAFGTMAVLRSNALSTGQSAVRALLGTVAGIVVGSALILLLGHDTTVFWALLPIAVVFTGLAPAVISFAAGQAGFTVVLLLLFSLIQPAGLKLGLVRVEDVAIGCAVSLVVGIVFWPRGAAAELRQTLADGLAESARYLRGAVEYGVSRCDTLVPATSEPGEENRRAAAAARRLDDAFRGFLTERGPKHVPLADVATLITAVAVLRLTAEAVLDLWRRDAGGSAAGDRTAARTEVLAAGDELARWYEDTATALTGSGTFPPVKSRDPAADARLLTAVHRDLSGADHQGTATAVKMIWTADHLDAARRLQPTLAGPVKTAAKHSSLLS
ncbi:FUSC family protein [Amycolatopsis rhabdoformis]|uniref:FUSC family protein n=1 Tax=Amycolatopsis rhabdoformis TaxID=1448059 RepID=A0ABZ1IG13_9PSEU|nr:FUSC family protein [Amycolatopsis rhabdoformis]WSE32726.1 FUSC family protein [Amycolatopsis rhabdoformis]